MGKIKMSKEVNIDTSADVMELLNRVVFITDPKLDDLEHSLSPKAETAKKIFSNYRKK
jgi:hypothetical protein